MIIEYHRPNTLEEALTLLARPQPLTVPLGGGAGLNRPSTRPFAVVDLQALGLNTLVQQGSQLELGATLTLQAFLEQAGEDGPLAALKRAARLEAARNLRQVATLAGTLVTAGGRSPFTTALLALDARLSLIDPAAPDAVQTVELGGFLALRPEYRRRLLTRVSLPLNARLAFESVARTPADRPIVCVAAAAWPSGRTRLALGGYGAAPTLAFDGSEAAGIDTAASSAYSQAGDQWASAAYRQHAAATLARRCAASLGVPPLETA